MTVIWNDTVAIGDCLNTFGTMAALINVVEKPVNVYFTNQQVGALFPYEKYGALAINELPSEWGALIKVSLHDWILKRGEWAGYNVSGGHMAFIEALMTRYGYQYVPGHFDTTITFPSDDTVPTYDFVIAPYKLNNAHENMTPEFWQSLVDALRTKYPSASLCVIGTDIVPRDEDLAKIEGNIDKFKNPSYLRYNFSRYLTGVDYFWNEPLTRVAQLMANVRKCFISADSGPSWVWTYLRSDKYHIELFHNWVLSRGRAEKDGVVPRFYTPTHIIIEEVLTAIEKALD